MTIIHVSSASTWRGGEQQIFYLASYLQDEKVDQKILCPRKSTLDIRARKAGMHVSMYTSFPLKAISAAFKLHRLLKTEKEVIVHAHDATALTSAYLCKKLFGDKFLLIMSRRIDDVPSDKSVTRKKYLSCDRIICVSEKIAEIMRSYLNKKEDIVTVHSGINVDYTSAIPHDMNLRDQFGIPENRFLIGNTSAIAAHKDYGLFVKAASELINENKGVHFVIVGDGPERERIERQVEALNISDHVTFAGFIPNASLLIKQFDLFLMTSSTEGLGTSLIDAMASNVPIVVSGVGGIPELIKQGVNGVVIDDRNPEKYANAILELIGDHEKSNRFTRASKELVQSFTYQETGRKTKLIYNEILKT